MKQIGFRPKLVAFGIAIGVLCIFNYQNCAPQTGAPFSIQTSGGGNTAASTSPTTPTPPPPPPPSTPLALSAISLSSPQVQVGTTFSATVTVSGTNLTGVNCAWTITTNPPTPATNTPMGAGNTCVLSMPAPAAGTYTLAVAATNSGAELANQSTTFTSAPVAPPAPTVAINCGGAGYTGPSGTVWSSDKDFSGGTADSPAGTTSNAPNNDGKVYQTNRDSNFTYSIPVPAGSHQVTLKFAEYYHDGAGERSFNVTINGTVVLTAFDIFAAAGGKYLAVDKTFTVSAPTGVITIVTQTIKDEAQINGILIY